MLTAERLEVRQGPVESDFFSRIGREDLRAVLTREHPWEVYTSEIYLDGFGLPGNGGLGILMGDLIAQAHRLGLPVEGVTLAYPQRWIQDIGPDFTIEDRKVPITLEQAGLEKHPDLPKFEIKANGNIIPLEGYRAVGGLPLHALSEPGLQNVYAATPESDHRIYQQACLGFGAPKLLRALGIDPSVNHLNEAAVFGIGLTQIDSLMQQGLSIQDALTAARTNTLFSNHTLEPAASGTVNQAQLEQYIFQNIAHPEANGWLQNLPRDWKGNLNLGLLSMEMAGRLNGVSALHAEIASRKYKGFNGADVEFAGVTNGIALARWVAPELYRLYQATGVYDEFDLPAEGYQFAVNGLNNDRLRKLKQEYKQDLRKYLTTRKDQYGQPINIPEDAIVACWAKRMHGYKRPELLLADPERLKEILEGNNMHILITGKVHSTDGAMKDTLRWLLNRVNSDDVLKDRVHFVQNYDEDLADKLIPGVDIWCNTPVVGKEACGTSWEKAIANLGILISTEDGGVADVKPAHYLKLEGDTYEQEVNSLYANLAKAGMIARGSDRGWGDEIKKQLRGYVPILSGARMIGDYFNLIPRELRSDKQPFLAIAA